MEEFIEVLYREDEEFCVDYMVKENISVFEDDYWKVTRK